MTRLETHRHRPVLGSRVRAHAHHRSARALRLFDDVLFELFAQIDVRIHLLEREHVSQDDDELLRVLGVVESRPPQCLRLLSLENRRRAFTLRLRHRFLRAALGVAIVLTLIAALAAAAFRLEFRRRHRHLRRRVSQPQLRLIQQRHGQLHARRFQKHHQPIPFHLPSLISIHLNLGPLRPRVQFHHAALFKRLKQFLLRRISRQSLHVHRARRLPRVHPFKPSRPARLLPPHLGPFRPFRRARRRRQPLARRRVRAFEILLRALIRVDGVERRHRATNLFTVVIVVLVRHRHRVVRPRRVVSRDESTARLVPRVRRPIVVDERRAIVAAVIERGLRFVRRHRALDRGELATEDVEVVVRVVGAHGASMAADEGLDGGGCHGGPGNRGQTMGGPSVSAPSTPMVWLGICSSWVCVFDLYCKDIHVYVRAVYGRASSARDRHSTTRAPIDFARSRRATR